MMRSPAQPDAILQTERDEGVLLLTLNRPEKRNALDPDLVGALSAALEGVTGDTEVGVVVLTGAGRSFCAGLDLHHLRRLDDEGRVAYMATAFALFRQLYTLRQPVIAAVNGPAMAGGFDLAAFCDIRICSVEARFAQTEVLLGLTQIMYPVYQVIGLGRARQLALTGDAVSADEAHRIGLVSGVYPAEDLAEEAFALARKLASRPREALFETKRLGRELIEMDTGSAFGRMFDVIATRLRSKEHRDAVQRYVEALERRR